MDNYYVRYGNGSTTLDRTDYDTLEKIKKAYDKIKLNTEITWKELIFEDLTREEHQEIIQSDEVKIIPFIGNSVIIVNTKEQQL